MDKFGTVTETEEGHVPEFRAENFTLQVSRDGWIGVTVEAGGRDVVTVVFPPDMADAISEHFSEKGRKALWQLVEATLNKGLN